MASTRGKYRLVTLRAAVYLETTIPSFYVTDRRDPASKYVREATRRWWDAHADEFTLVTSAFTVRELAAAPDPVRTEALALMQAVPLLEVPDRFEEVVATLIEHRVMPAEAQGDAAHLAMATLYGCDYLLTWNCRHLANARKVRHIEAVCRMLGLPAPLIVTPEALLKEIP